MKFYCFDGDVFLLVVEELDKAYWEDVRIPQKIGVTRQAFHGYLQGRMAPRDDRARVLQAIVPSAFKFVGRVDAEA